MEDRKGTRKKPVLALLLLIGMISGVEIVVLTGTRLPAATGAGHHEVQGAARLLGLIPLGLAGVLCLGLIPAKKPPRR